MVHLVRSSLVGWYRKGIQRNVEPRHLTSRIRSMANAYRQCKRRVDASTDRGSEMISSYAEMFCDAYEKGVSFPEPDIELQVQLDALEELYSECSGIA